MCPINSKMTHIQDVITKFNNRAIFYDGEIVPTFDYLDSLRLKVAKEFVCLSTIYSLIFTMGIAMADIRTIRNYLAVLICLSVNYYAIYSYDREKQEPVIIDHQPNTTCQSVNPITSHTNSLIDGTIEFLQELRDLTWEVDIQLADIDAQILHCSSQSLELIEMVKTLQKTFKRIQCLAYSNQVTAKSILMESNPLINIPE
ncbi:uncharacterized protein EV154DRAFT_530203 [Mucor mucedo]|uniref:uncharacterized protein n=1 Tax=Mucor mucedo TaxID=29922 RepID=UPI00221E4AB4|nr:uncharacterized protein EV154DRAFT_530203 [Mucor mucedo]KAI7870084.1 hypothetical protein EV154DRAFT_530203 [Mucor mucedo]